MGPGIEPGERLRLELSLAEIDAALLRFATYTQHKSQWRIAATLANKGLTLMRLERYEEGVEVCGEVVRLYGDRSDSPTQVLVAGALLQQGIALTALGRANEAIAAYDDLLGRFGQVTGNPDLAEVVATAGQLRLNRDSV
jgi:tetratricopeptide (TPR) repeat protein